jgi:Uma2 family endonuclease
VFFEVLSPSSGADDLIHKLEEYTRLPTARQYVVIDPATPFAKIWLRKADGSWSEEKLEGLDAVLHLPAIDVSLPMAVVYEGVEFDPPRTPPGW